MRVLREVGQLLVDVNGQHAALSLKDGATRVRCACCSRLTGTEAAVLGMACALQLLQDTRFKMRLLQAAGQHSAMGQAAC